MPSTDVKLNAKQAKAQAEDNLRRAKELIAKSQLPLFKGGPGEAALLEYAQRRLDYADHCLSVSETLDWLNLKDPNGALPD